MKEVNRRKGYKENTIHSSEVHTLAEEEKPDEGAGAAFIYRALQVGRQAGWLAGWRRAYRPAYWASSHYPSSGEVSLLPGAIDCLCCTEQGTDGGGQSIECRPALDGEARVVERNDCVAWRQQLDV
jgi:hypothetical protein